MRLLAFISALRLRHCIMRFRVLAIANIVAAQSAQADVGSAMNSFFNGMGGAANATGPIAYQGQASGYYSGGTSGCARPTSRSPLARCSCHR
jgi:hypothetical protein